jgi:hypothetical protein
MNPDSVAAEHPETHDCPQYRLEDTTTTTTAAAPRYVKCKSCSYDIYFDEKQKSDQYQHLRNIIRKSGTPNARPRQ